MGKYPLKWSNLPLKWGFWANIRAIIGENEQFCGIILGYYWSNIK